MFVELLDGCELLELLEPLLDVVPVEITILPGKNGLMNPQKIASAPFDCN
jgi:hypothetical protein